MIICTRIVGFYTIITLGWGLVQSCILIRTVKWKRGKSMLLTRGGGGSNIYFLFDRIIYEGRGLWWCFYSMWPASGYDVPMRSPFCKQLLHSLLLI